MRARKPSRKELRELGEGLLAFAEFMGYLYLFGAALQAILRAPSVLDGLVVGVCITVMAVRRCQRWLNKAREREQAD